MTKDFYEIVSDIISRLDVLERYSGGGGSGGGDVSSVNGFTGVVVLDADDISDTSTTNKYVTATDLINLGNLSGENTGDQSASDFAHNSLSGLNDGTSYEHITQTQKDKLDGIEEGAEVNVQSDWTETDTGDDAYIKNKPSDIVESVVAGDDIDIDATDPANPVVSFDGTIPTALSELSDDSTHRIVTDTEKSTWNAKSDFDGDYDNLTNKPTIPTDTGDLTNGAGFITAGDIPADAVDSVNGQTGEVSLSADDITDIDTSTTAPTKNKVLKWNGSNWIPADYDQTFTFSIASFSDNEGTLELIGSGTWQAVGAMSFSATYNNGPPTSSDIELSINGASYSTIGTMDSPAYTSGDNTDAISFPASKDQYLRFRLSSSDGEDNDTSTESAIYFRNNIFYGVASKGSGFSEADVEGLANSTISNDVTRSMALNAGSGEYLVFAYPASYSSINATGFLFNGITCPFESYETVSITNANGYTENYKVYASSLANLGSSTLVTTTSSSLINRLYYGVTTSTGSFTESDVEGLANSEISNDNTQAWDSVTAGAGEYLLFAFPTRLGIPDFYVGGFEGGFESPETVSVTNVNGYTEDYYVWRSTNSGLGATSVVTQ